MNTSANEKMRKEFDKWADSYGLEYEPGYSKLVRSDCFAAWQAALSTVHTQEVSEEAVGEIEKIAEWLDNSATLAQSDFDSPPEPQSQFDYELIQAAARLRELCGQLQASQQQEQSGEAPDPYNLHCETCNGHGYVPFSIRHGETDFEDGEQECPVCDGVGKAPKHVQDLQARYQEVRSELHALNIKIGMESVLGTSPAPPTATAIAAMVIKQAAEAVRNVYAKSTQSPDEFGILSDAANAVLAITPANAEAELSALMMEVAKAINEEHFLGGGDLSSEQMLIVVRQAIKDM